jgi:hypothetical protein
VDLSITRSAVQFSQYLHNCLKRDS